MSSQSSRSDGGRGRLSRDERVKLFRKDRSRTSGRESGRGDHFEHCRTARSRTSGRDLNQRGYSDSRQVARSRTSGRESDGGRKQVLDENANRDKRSLNNDDNIKDERSPFRLNNNDMKRESQAENHSRRRGRNESQSIEDVGRFRLRGEFERRSPSSSRGLARQYSHYGEASKVKEYRLRGWNREAGCFDDERSLRVNSRGARQSPYRRENQRTSTSKHFHSLDASRRREFMESYQESKNERGRSRSHKTLSEKEVKREVLLAREKKAVDPQIDMSVSGKNHKKKSHHQVRDDGSKSRAGQKGTAHVEESNGRDVKQHKKSVGKEEEMKSISVKIKNSQEPLISTAQLCAKGQLSGEMKICREVKRGCSKEKQMGENNLGRIDHEGGIEVNESSEDIGAQKVSHPAEIVCVGLEEASTSKKEVPEEVSSQRTLEMSLEDDSLQEDDPIERERKQVLQELEIVVQQKSSQQVIMEKIRAEIGELESELAASLEEEVMLKKQERDLQEKLARSYKEN